MAIGGLIWFFAGDSTAEVDLTETASAVEESAPVEITDGHSELGPTQGPPSSSPRASSWARQRHRAKWSRWWPVASHLDRSHQYRSDTAAAQLVDGAILVTGSTEIPFADYEVTAPAPLWSSRWKITASSNSRSGYPTREVGRLAPQPTSGPTSGEAFPLRLIAACGYNSTS
jgi:hypothetical protein